MSYISTQTHTHRVYNHYLELSQEKSSFIGNLPLVGVQQTICYNGLNKYQPVFIIYNNQTSHISEQDTSVPLIHAEHDYSSSNFSRNLLSYPVTAPQAYKRE